MKTSSLDNLFAYYVISGIFFWSFFIGSGSLWLVDKLDNPLGSWLAIIVSLAFYVWTGNLYDKQNTKKLFIRHNAYH